VAATLTRRGPMPDGCHGLRPTTLRIPALSSPVLGAAKRHLPVWDHVPCANMNGKVTESGRWHLVTLGQA